MGVSRALGRLLLLHLALDLLEVLRDLVAHLGGAALLLLDLGADLRQCCLGAHHQLPLVSLALRETRLRSLHGGTKSRVDGLHRHAEVGDGCGELTADVRHRRLAVAAQGPNAIRDEPRLALQGIDARRMVVGHLDQLRDGAVQLLCANGNARNRHAQRSGALACWRRRLR